MAQEQAPKIIQFLKYFGKKGIAPKLEGWEFAADEFIRDKTFNSVVVVYYKEGEEYVGRAEAGYREGFYSAQMEVSNGITEFKPGEKVASVDFEYFYRNFQKALMRMSKYVENSGKEYPKEELDIDYKYNSFIDVFGENGSFISNPDWVRDEVLEEEEFPSGLSVFYTYVKGNNSAFLLASTDYDTFDASLEVYKGSVVVREEDIRNILNIDKLQDVLVNYMRISEADLAS